MSFPNNNKKRVRKRLILPHTFTSSLHLPSHQITNIFHIFFSAPKKKMCIYKLLEDFSLLFFLPFFPKKKRNLGVALAVEKRQQPFVKGTRREERRKKIFLFLSSLLFRAFHFLFRQKRDSRKKGKFMDLFCIISYTVVSRDKIFLLPTVCVFFFFPFPFHFRILK